MSNERLEQFRRRWGIDLTLPPDLHSHVEGRVLQWEEEWLQQLEQVLDHLPRAIINAARVTYLFVADDLRHGWFSHKAVTYEFRGQPEPKWIGLNVSLLTDQRDETEPYLQAPLLEAGLLEEIAHVWDSRLEENGSPYSSAGAEWLDVECDQRGRPKPFNIRNRKNYDQISEDWASAVVWFVFQPDELRRRSPERCEFVERLFERCLLS